MLSILAAMTMLAQAPAPPSAAAPPAAGRTVHADISFAGAARRRPAPYELARGVILVRGTVAGRDAWILLDTGAGRTVVDAGLARSAGLRVEQAPISIATPGRPLAGNRVADLAIAIPGQMDVRLSWALSTDLGPVSTLLGRRVDAILGWDILSRIAFLVDPRGPALSFFGPGMLTPPAGAAWITLSPRGRIPVVVGKEEVSLFVDLGSNHVVGLSPDAWERLAPEGTETRPYGVTHAEGQRVVARMGVLPDIVLGSTTFRNVSTVIQAGRPDEAEGHVGMGLFARFVFMLDAGRGRLWFLPAQPAAPAPGARPGSAIPDAGR